MTRAQQSTNNSAKFINGVNLISADVMKSLPLRKQEITAPQTSNSAQTEYREDDEHDSMPELEEGVSLYTPKQSARVDASLGTEDAGHTSPLKATRISETEAEAGTAADEMQSFSLSARNASASTIDDEGETAEHKYPSMSKGGGAMATDVMKSLPLRKQEITAPQTSNSAQTEYREDDEHDSMPELEEGVSLYTPKQSARVDDEGSTLENDDLEHIIRPIFSREIHPSQHRLQTAVAVYNGPKTQITHPNQKERDSESEFYSSVLQKIALSADATIKKTQQRYSLELGRIFGDKHNHESLIGKAFIKMIGLEMAISEQLSPILEKFQDNAQLQETLTPEEHETIKKICISFEINIDTKNLQNIETQQKVITLLKAARYMSQAFQKNIKNAGLFSPRNLTQDEYGYKVSPIALRTKRVHKTLNAMGYNLQTLEQEIAKRKVNQSKSKIRYATNDGLSSSFAPAMSGGYSSQTKAPMTPTKRSLHGGMLLDESSTTHGMYNRPDLPSPKNKTTSSVGFDRSL